MAGFTSEYFCNKGSLHTPPPRGRPQAPTPPSITTNVRKNIMEATEANPILYQVTCQVVFYPD